MDKKDLYNSINQHLSSIDDSLKTLAWVQSATLSMNKEDDTNDVPEDALVYSNAEDALPYSNDIKKEQDGE
ncbi:hypothetical protein DN448_03195 [Lactobacillus reuteri]|nr:hypothetical protein [Limosilactobacillus reuteri]